jgi:hypothetical protein
MEIVIDTTVVFRANVPLAKDRAQARLLARRIALLKRVQDGLDVVLMSERLLHEYTRQVLPPKNELLKAFLEVLTSQDGGRVIWNWKQPWSGGDRSKARSCRFPEEDDHVLRTAIRDASTTIYSEEGRMTKADRCIYRAFRVHINEP